MVVILASSDTGFQIDDGCDIEDCDVAGRDVEGPGCGVGDVEGPGCGIGDVEGLGSGVVSCDIEGRLVEAGAGPLVSNLPFIAIAMASSLSNH